MRTRSRGAGRLKPFPPSLEPLEDRQLLSGASGYAPSPPDPVAKPAASGTAAPADASTPYYDDGDEAATSSSASQPYGPAAAAPGQTSGAESYPYPSSKETQTPGSSTNPAYVTPSYAAADAALRKVAVAVLSSPPQENVAPARAEAVAPAPRAGGGETARATAPAPAVESHAAPGAGHAPLAADEEPVLPSARHADDPALVLPGSSDDAAPPLHAGPVAEPAPQLGGVLAGVLPANLAALEASADRFFTSLRNLTGRPAGGGLRPWLILGFLATGAYEVARRMREKPAAATLTARPLPRTESAGDETP